MLCLNRSQTCAMTRRSARPAPARMLSSRIVARSAAAGTGANQDDDDHLVAEFKAYIKDELQEAGALRDGLLMSDVVSQSKDGPLQWVDIVLAGGGLLGIAHVGFVCILEEAGVRFRGIGGTSAGAINAIVIAATRKTPADKSWEDTLKILAKTDFGKFQDGKGVDNTNALLKSVLGSGGGPSNKTWAWAIIKALPEVCGIWQRCGLHPGDKFQDWIRDILKKEKIATVQQLQDRMDLAKSGLTIREGVTPPDNRASMVGDAADVSKAELKLVTSDIVTQTKVVFPEDAKLYYANPLQQDPSGFVRASMSVPLFFEPYKISNIPKNDPFGSWADSGYTGTIPDEAVFVDGGTLSNFPISLFDVKGVPLLPTVGCQLGLPRATPQPAGNPFELYKAMNNTSRHIGDYDFVHENPIYKPLVATADTDGFGWLDFDMPREEQKRLFKNGAIAGRDLLKKFKRTPDPKKDTWAIIKKKRAGIAEKP